MKTEAAAWKKFCTAVLLCSQLVLLLLMDLLDLDKLFSSFPQILLPSH